MRRALLWIGVFGLMFLGARATYAASTRWSTKMQELYRTLSDLLTDVTSDDRYRDPANRGRILTEAKKLSALSHDLHKKGMEVPDADPTLQIVSGLLAQESKRAVHELERDNRGYARVILRSIPSYCIACHTRNGSGPQFGNLPFEPGEGLLSLMERGNYFAATRQFERAQDQYLQLIRNPKKATDSPFEWERAVRQGLSIAIRVRQDAGHAEAIVDEVLRNHDAPVSIRHNAEVWKTSIAEWKSEAPRQAVTEEGLRAEALRLMGKAHELQRYPMDRTGDVYYLRASAVVHQLLQTAPQGRYANEALLMAGLCYEVLSPIGLEDLHDIYYEACVRRAPHSQLAGLCYERFEESIFLGFSGSGGTEVPEDVREKLVELKEIARPLPEQRR